MQFNFLYSIHKRIFDVSFKGEETIGSKKKLKVGLVENDNKESRIYSDIYMSNFCF